MLAAITWDTSDILSEIASATSAGLPIFVALTGIAVGLMAFRKFRRG